MSKNYCHLLSPSPKLTKHQQEMDILRAHHERVLSNDALRQETLVGAGVFVRTADGKLAVAKQYDKVITATLAA